MDFQTVRIYGSLVVILGCLIFLYPKLLHPLILTMFGMNAKPENTRNEDILPPTLRGQHPHLADQDQGDLHENIKKMRHGPHPGMRAAATEQAKQTKGSGRGGMMGVILPMYAIGIVLYLVYTLVKVFGKQDNKDRSEQSGSPVRGQRSPPRSKTPEGEEEEMDMHKLQERLAETEAQMTKILQAMQSVQSKMGDLPTASSTNQNTSAGQSAEDGQNVHDVSGNSTESTPDLESYEMVNKSDRESGGEEQDPNPVETLDSKARDEDTNDEKTKDNTDKEEGEEEEENAGEEVLLDDISKASAMDSTVRKRVTKAADTADS